MKKVNGIEGDSFDSHIPKTPIVGGRRQFSCNTEALNGTVPRILEQAGFVKRKIVGREHQITIHSKSLKKTYQWIALHRKLWEERLDRLDDYLKNSMNKKAHA